MITPFLYKRGAISIRVPQRASMINRVHVACLYKCSARIVVTCTYEHYLTFSFLFLLG